MPKFSINNTKEPVTRIIVIIIIRVPGLLTANGSVPLPEQKWTRSSSPSQNREVIHGNILYHKHSN